MTTETPEDREKLVKTIQHFSLGISVARYLQRFPPRRDETYFRAIMRVLIGVVDEEITLLDSPEEIARSLRPESKSAEKMIREALPAARGHEVISAAEILIATAELFGKQPGT